MAVSITVNTGFLPSYKLVKEEQVLRCYHEQRHMLFFRRHVLSHSPPHLPVFLVALCVKIVRALREQ